MLIRIRSFLLRSQDLDFPFAVDFWLSAATMPAPVTEFASYNGHRVGSENYTWTGANAVSYQLSSYVVGHAAICRILRLH